MKRPEQSVDLLSNRELTRIETKIAGAELMTSAEIKVVIAAKSADSIEKAADRIFKKYKLHNTKARNCVLILLVIASHEFLVYGDQGIHTKVGPAFWTEMRDRMAALLAGDRIGDGLCLAIHMAADRLAEYFPYNSDDANELSNKVVFE